MRFIALLLLALVGATSLASTGQERAQAAGGSLIGQPAPRLVLKTIDGGSLDLGALYGKQAVYLKFWATWCVPCREQMPHFERTFEQASAKLAVIAVDVGFNDSLEDVRSYQRTVGLKMPIVIDDGRLAAALNLRVTPQHVVIGRDGRVLYVGHLVDARLEHALASAVAVPVAPATDAPAARLDAALAVGDRLPQLSVLTVDGKTVPLHDGGHRGPTVLVFLSPWCESYLASSRPERSAACRAVREQVEGLAATGGRTRWLGIASGLWADRADLAQYGAEHKIAIPLVLDESGTLFRRFGVTNVPTLVVVDADGRIVRRRSDAGDELRHELEILPAT
jgi:peroxiredoxin